MSADVAGVTPLLTRLDARLRRIPDWGQLCLALAAVACLTVASLTGNGHEAHVTDFLILPVGAVAWLARSRVPAYITALATVAATEAASLGSGAATGPALAAGVARLVLYGIVIAVLTALRNERAIIMRAATIDHQTGAANPRAFDAVAQLELERSRRYGHPLSLLFLDIDDFKLVNDNFGHAEGDRVLEKVGEALRRCVRRQDLVGRLGGDEFAVLMPEADKTAARALAARMRELVRAVKTPDGRGVHFSIGVATYATPPGTVDEMLREADRLMYRAKREGKDRVCARALWAPSSGTGSV